MRFQGLFFMQFGIENSALAINAGRCDFYTYGNMISAFLSC